MSDRRGSSDLAAFIADREGFERVEPLDEESLRELEDLLRTKLPQPVRSFYARCGGAASTGSRGRRLPLRPYPRGDIEDTARIFEDPENAFDPCPDARYLFGDDNSNWAGVFVSGPLAGKWLLLDHDEPEWTPRFSDTRSFYGSLINATLDGVGFEEMRTDYPMARDAPTNVIDDAAPLSAHYLGVLAREELDIVLARRAAHNGLTLLPPSETETLRRALMTPEQLASAPFGTKAIIARTVRLLALAVAAHQEQKALVPDVREIAAAARANNDYTLWARAVAALIVMGDVAGQAREVKLSPSNWPAPRPR